MKNQKKRIIKWIQRSPSTRNPFHIIHNFGYYFFRNGFLYFFQKKYGDAYYKDLSRFDLAYHLFGQVLYKYFKPRTCCDMGCGHGVILSMLKQQGVDVVGYDKSHAFKAAAPKELCSCLNHFDLTTIGQFSRYELVICTEVAEHIAHSKSDVLVQNICSASHGFIIFSAASPGQRGEGHINCMPSSFWVDLFLAQGVKFENEITADIKKLLMQKVEIKQISWLMENLLVFSNPTLVD